ncbi:MAG: DUF4230 domain-containing protein [Endomicrobium sp.]|jgi:hypothetical protein|nr:DUF4230 domain-containing protein [Endomicrobium sp.]
MYLKYSVVLFVLILTLGAGIFIGSKFAGGKAIEKESKTDIKATVKEILPAAEYTSLVYHYTSVITHSEAAKLFSVDIPLTEKKAIYTIDGAIKMGFNCENIKIEITYDNIIMYMPRITILSHEIYPETFSLYDERSSLFNRYTLKDANAIQLANKSAMELKARQNRGLYVQARKFAEQQFTVMLGNMPWIKGKYSIIFEWNGEKTTVNE